MSYNLKQVSQDEFGFTTDEDIPISHKLGRLQSLQYHHFFAKDTETKEESPIAKLDFSSFIKPNPFDKSISTITDSTNADTLAKTSTISEYGKNKSQSLPETSQFLTARGGLKSRNKAKYLKWHDYIADCERQGVLPNSRHLEVKFTVPYFRNGGQEHLAQWDESRWKDEEEWWEGDLWRFSGIGSQKLS